MTPIMRVSVDGLACIATEACLQVETHVFFRKQDDYVPGVAADADRYFESHRRQIIQSALSCPVAAISVEFSDGKVITSNDYDESAGFDQWVDY